MATWKKVLLEGGVTGTAPIDVTSDVVSLDLKTNGGLVVESDELAVDLGATAITGVLAVDNGGTGLAAIAANSVLVANTADTLTVETATTDGHVLTYVDSTNGVQWGALPASSNAFSIINPGEGDTLEADAAGDTLNINGIRGVVATGSNDNATDTLVVSLDFVSLTQSLDESTIAAGDLFIVEDINESTAANKQKKITAADLQDFVLGGKNLVTQVIGTANQIAASGPTGDVTLSTPATFIAPGSIASTSTITAATGLTVTAGGAVVTDGGLTVSAGGASITGNTTVTGNLTVTGTTTTLQTENVLIEDKLLVLGYPDSAYASNAAAVTGATGGGISVLSDTDGSEGSYAAVMWNNHHLAGWELMDANSVAASPEAKHPIAIMDFVVNSATAPTVDSAGVGSFFFAQANASTDGALYVRVQ